MFRKKKPVDRTGRTGEVFWVYPFMVSTADPSFPREWNCPISLTPKEGWLRVEVNGWGRDGWNGKRAHKLAARTSDDNKGLNK